MDRSTAIRALCEHESEIRARGVRGLSLFGSVARNEARPDSDVDILIDLDEAHGLSLFDLMALQHHLCDILDAPVDMTIRRNIRPFLRNRILSESVPVF